MQYGAPLYDEFIYAARTLHSSFGRQQRRVERNPETLLKTSSIRFVQHTFITQDLDTPLNYLVEFRIMDNNLAITLRTTNHTLKGES
ncbi:unnamed protein product [Schistosoma rodhaini]|uniref:Uncharacterized protein n=1 Tax=Schistosoma rodhaini TaxID=6188 RepID=A0AA85FCS8_9TREM|nr:unnamed protein product [Schistosoma rodhaini]